MYESNNVSGSGCLSMSSTGSVLTITVVVDNDSWILPYARDLVKELKRAGHDATLVRSWDDVPQGDIAFFLGCVTKAPSAILERNEHNLVVHESALPEGRGFAPMTWQILQGKSHIPIVLFEAANDLDSGPIYLQDEIQLEGHELNEEWRHLQGEKTLALCHEFVERYPDINPSPQDGESSEYPRRTPSDSELDPDKTLRELFPLLRVVDNDRYPAFFDMAGHRCVLQIEKEGLVPGDDKREPDPPTSARANPRPTKRVRDVKPSASIDLAEEAARREAEGQDIADLSWGEPHQDTPEAVREAAQDAMEAGHTHYVPTPGIQPLREAIASYLKRDRGISYEPDSILVTPGGKQAIQAAVHAYAGPKDEVIAPAPYWLSYRDITNLAGARFVPVPSRPSDAFVPDVEAIKEAVTNRTRVLLVNSPANPTGAVYPEETLRAFVDLANDHDIVLVSDEVYSNYVYGAEHVSPAALPGGMENTLIVDSFSKKWAMTGWRVGVLGGREQLLEGPLKILQHTATCACSVSQHAAIAALQHAPNYPNKLANQLADHRQIIGAAFDDVEEIGPPTSPKGAMYVFLDVREINEDSRQVSKNLLAEGVSVVPGTAYGDAGEGFIRIAYGGPTEEVKKGAARLRDWAKETREATS